MDNRNDKDHVALQRRVEELERRLEALRDAEEQVLGARAQAQALLDNIPHMAWMKDVDGVLLAVNESFARAAGRRKEEVLGRTDADLWPPELAERYVADDARVMARSEKIFVEEPIAQPSGTTWFETFKTPIRDARGKISGTVGLARDITQRKEDEAQRRQLRERMQQAQKLESIGVLAGGIAHDFNNLLTGVLANAELAIAHLDAGKPGARDRLADIRRAATSAAELTNQMLAYSGRGRFVARALSLNSVVEELGQLLRASISKKAQLELSLEDSLPAVVADVAQMHQLVMNLITNASEALQERRGTIRVQTLTREIDGEVPDLLATDTLEAGAYVVLKVTDDGCGIDASTRARLFEPFFTTKFTGRGLGLSAVQGIVRGHGGGIAIRSAVGEGTEIEVLLPRSEHRVAAPTAAPTEPTAAWPEGGRVLLVDDDPTVRTVTALLLESLGFDVVAAANGEEALALFGPQPGQFLVVVLDVTMPDMNGEHVLAGLREQRPDLPVVLMSGFTEQEMQQRFSARDVAGFVQKPFGIEALRGRLRQVLHERGGE